MLNVVALSVVMLSVIMLSVVMLSVVMVSVVAPFIRLNFWGRSRKKTGKNPDHVLIFEFEIMLGN